jgi:hypothetical protein
LPVLSPLIALLSDIGATLLRCHQGFF